MNKIKIHGLTDSLQFYLQLKKKLRNVFKQVRDEVKRHDPCLVEFTKLSEQERNQNLQMTQDILR